MPESLSLKTLILWNAAIQEKYIPANIYLFNVDKRRTRKRVEICSKLTIKTPEQRHYVVLVFLLLTLNIIQTFFCCFYC